MTLDTLREYNNHRSYKALLIYKTSKKPQETKIDIII